MIGWECVRQVFMMLAGVAGVGVGVGVAASARMIETRNMRLEDITPDVAGLPEHQARVGRWVLRRTHRMIEVSPAMQ